MQSIQQEQFIDGIHERVHGLAQHRGTARPGRRNGLGCRNQNIAQQGGIDDFAWRRMSRHARLYSIEE
jgi:hypothetical protein